MAANFAEAVIVFKGLNKLSKPLREGSKGMKDLKKRAKETAASIRNAAMSANTMVNKLGASLRRMVSGLGILSIGGIVMGGKSAIETSAQLEAIETAIRFVSGSAEEGNNNMEFLRNTVKNLKTDYLVTAESFKRFLGAMKATNYEASVQRDMFYKMGAATRVLGLDAQSTERVFYALGEMFSKGQVMSQELKLQLGNALPGAVQMFAKSMGLSNKAFRKMMEDGNVGTDKIKGFVDYVYEQFKEGIPDAVRTTAANLQGLRNNWTFMMQDIGDSLAKAGVLDFLSEIMLKMSEWVKANKELIRVNIAKAIDGIRKGLKWLSDNKDDIIRSIKMIIGAFLGIKAVLSVISLLTLAVGVGAPLVLGVIALGAAVGAGVMYFRDYRKEISATTDELSSIESMIVGVGNLIDAFTMPTFENFGKKIIAGLGQMVLSLFQMIAELSQQQFKSWGNAIGLDDNMIARFFGNAASDYGNWSKKLDTWALTKDQISNMRGEQTSDIGGFSSYMKDILNNRSQALDDFKNGKTAMSEKERLATERYNAATSRIETTLKIINNSGNSLGYEANSAMPLTLNPQQ